jgi:hypothetical protein
MSRLLLEFCPLLQGHYMPEVRRKAARPNAGREFAHGDKPCSNRSPERKRGPIVIDQAFEVEARATAKAMQMGELPPASTPYYGRVKTLAEIHWGEKKWSAMVRGPDQCSPNVGRGWGRSPRRAASFGNEGSRS